MKTYSPGTQKSSILKVWTIRGAPETTPEGEALRAQPFGVVYRAPKIDEFWVPGESIFIKQQQQLRESTL